MVIQKISLIEYKELKKNNKLLDRREQVYLAIKSLGECTNKEISEFLGWEINRVTPRVLELREKEKTVEFAGLKVCEYSGKRVNSWRLKNV